MKQEGQAIEFLYFRGSASVNMLNLAHARAHMLAIISTFFQTQSPVLEEKEQTMSFTTKLFDICSPAMAEAAIGKLPALESWDEVKPVFHMIMGCCVEYAFVHRLLDFSWRAVEDFYNGRFWPFVRAGAVATFFGACWYGPSFCHNDC